MAFVDVLLPVDAESLWEEGAEGQRTSAWRVPWVPRATALTRDAGQLCLWLPIAAAYSDLRMHRPLPKLMHCGPR